MPDVADTILTQVFFEHIDVAICFMLEVAAMLAAEMGSREDSDTVMLIDNEGWDGSVMTGSACRSRYLMGKPSVMEAGPRAMWHLRRIFPSRALSSDVKPMDSAKSREDGIELATEEKDEWWLCEITLQGRRVPVALLPEELIDGGGGRHRGHLRALRTCSSAERAAMRGASRTEELQVLWS
jgi:hypothetical protein